MNYDFLNIRPKKPKEVRLRECQQPKANPAIMVIDNKRFKFVDEYFKGRELTDHINGNIFEIKNVEFKMITEDGGDQLERYLFIYLNIRYIGPWPNFDPRYVSLSIKGEDKISKRFLRMLDCYFNISKDNMNVDMVFLNIRHDWRKPLTSNL